MVKDNVEQVSLNIAFFSEGGLQVVVCPQFLDAQLTLDFTHTYMKDSKQGAEDTSPGIPCLRVSA